MAGFFVTFRSVTFAQRAERLLHRRGIACQLQRTPRWMEAQGCGYSIWLPKGDIAQVLPVLSEEGIAYRKVYWRTPEGKLEEVER